MTHARSQAELVTLRKLAQDLASARKERVTSVHLLAAIAAAPGPAGELLRERRLDDEALLKASRAFDDDGPDPIGRLLASARQVAMRRLWYGTEASPRGAGDAPSAPRPHRNAGRPSANTPTPEPGALHLLLALLSDRSAAAHRSLVHAGVDLARLRTAAMQIALGVVAARRVPAPPARGSMAELAPSPAHPAAGAQRARPSSPPPNGPGVAVPFIPPAPARAPRNPTPTPPRMRGGASRTIASPSPPLPARGEGASRAASPPLPARAGVGSPERFALDRASFPVLAAIGHNLTLAAAEGRLDEVVGREDEIERALDVLAKRHANSPCLVGPAGVGKTSVARGLARRLAELDAASDAPRVLVEIVVSEIIAGTSARGALAERVAALRSELREAGGRVILFVDEVHELFGSGALDEAMAELKLGLARGDLRLVGATTPEEYRKTIESDGALSRRFSPVEIEEPGAEDAFLLLRSVAAGLGKHHGLTYSDEAIARAVAWSIRYLPGRALPDKAISVLDLSGARARRRLAASGSSAKGAVVGLPEVAGVVAEIADLPVERLLETDRERMLAMEKLLADRVVGHGAALARIARVLRRNAAGLGERRPIGSFLLLGPTGVGKTETARALAEALFHAPDAMTRLDFSEYAEAHAVARLIGAPPGYIGHEAGGQLTEAVRRRPYQVILLDEIEKAHRDVLEAFLQVFDDGRLTDGRGRRVDFTNTVIVMTSNLGAAEVGALRAERSVGFARSGETRAAPERVAETMIAAARAYLPPELYNRIDEVLCFGPLSRAEVAEIARRLLGGLEDGLADRGIRLDVDPAAIEALLAAGGFDVELGARPMKRTIARLIENPLAELILRGDLAEGDVALIGVEKGEIVVDAVDGDRAAAG
jgi:ATP-dependent Clp protease ATP-binding subunit ClpC